VILARVSAGPIRSTQRAEDHSVVEMAGQYCPTPHEP